MKSLPRSRNIASTALRCLEGPPQAHSRGRLPEFSKAARQLEGPCSTCPRPGRAPATGSAGSTSPQMPRVPGVVRDLDQGVCEPREAGTAGLPPAQAFGSWSPACLGPLSPHTIRAMLPRPHLFTLLPGHRADPLPGPNQKVPQRVFRVWELLLEHSPCPPKSAGKKIGRASCRERVSSPV